MPRENIHVRISRCSKDKLDRVCSYYGQNLKERLDRLIDADYQAYLERKKKKQPFSFDGLGEK